MPPTAVAERTAPANLCMTTCLAVMRSIGDYTAADFDTLGITPEAYQLACSNKCWQPQERKRVEQVLEALLFGTADVMALGRIDLPAEFVAATISAFVAPANHYAACRFLSEKRMTGIAVADGGSGARVDPVSHQQLFHLVIGLLPHDETTQARQAFHARLSKRAQQALNK